MKAQGSSAPLLQLPKRVNHLLATLSRIYRDQREHQAQKVIVNAKLRVKEDREGEVDLDYKRYGHTVYLDVPESLYPTSGVDRLNL